MREALLVIIAARIGAVAGIFVASLQAHRQREAQYDIDLRKKRIPAYQKLWKCFEPFAYHSPPRPVTFGKLRDISTVRRSWYYKSAVSSSYPKRGMLTSGYRESSRRRCTHWCTVDAGRSSTSTVVSTSRHLQAGYERRWRLMSRLESGRACASLFSLA